MSDDKTTWDAINELAHEVAGLREDFRTATGQAKARHRAEPRRITPDVVRGISFTMPRMKPGYWDQEVDAFLDEVEHELETLIRERDDARAEAARLRAELDREAS